MSGFDSFFRAATGFDPYPYQRKLALEPWPDALDVPTGLGKTAAVTLAWLWKRGWREGGREAADAATPRRLVWCLPMRVLVEQTAAGVRRWLEALGLADSVAVHRLLGGEVSRDWVRAPAQDAILVGTQDMLLSRALMRGYGLSRYRWPMEFALLHNDAFWVFDEVQLMGVGMATSAQLEAFRRRLATARPARSLWVSATLRPQWLQTVDFAPHLDDFRVNRLDAAERQEVAVARRLEAKKALAPAPLALDADTARSNAKVYLQGLADLVVEHHQPDTLTLVVVNRVARAQALYKQLKKDRRLEAPLLLVHSRFRPAERMALNEKLMAGFGSGVIVATQAVEAGVDLSARTLFTELAPWSSLVQRFGRCNRHGEQPEARIFWLDIQDERQAPPYAPEDLAAARTRLEALDDAGPGRLPPVEEAADWAQVIRWSDFLELFDTDPDLSGFDVDVSPYVRDSDHRDLMVFWRDPGDAPDDQPAPAADELCRVPLGDAKRLLDRLRKQDRHPWYWDHLEGGWRPWHGGPRPGLVLMLDAAWGGYDPELGFEAGHKKPVPVLAAAGQAPEADEDERLTTLGRAVALDEHLCHVQDQARALAEALEAPEAEALALAGRWHDLGKAHPAFQTMLRDHFDDPAAAADRLWAKAPRAGRPDYRVDGQPRRHFRHELASMLAWLAHAGDHPQADLIAYLILAHHGKLRMRLRALPGETLPPDDRLFCRGLWAGDQLPAARVCNQEVPATTLALDLMQLGDGPSGPSWASRAQALLEAQGPFRLAWLETLVRLADWQASAAEQEEGA